MQVEPLTPETVAVCLQAVGGAGERPKRGETTREYSRDENTMTLARETFQSCY